MSCGNSFHLFVDLVLFLLQLQSLGHLFGFVSTNWLAGYLFVVVLKALFVCGLVGLVGIIHNLSSIECLKEIIIYLILNIIVYYQI